MIKKELGKTFQHAGIYSLGVILSRGISFLMLPIYTRFLSPADYGVLELLEMTVEVISIITGMGILQGMAKFYYQYDEEKDRKELVSTIFILIVSGYSLTCLFGGLFSSNISRLVFSSTEYTYLIMVSFLNLFLQITVFTSLTFIRVQQKSWLFVTVNAVKLIIQLFLNILFVVYFKMGVIGILYSTAIACILMNAWLLYYTFSKVNFRFSFEKSKTLIKFGYPFIVTGMGAFILTYSDRYFLQHFQGLNDVGLYALAYKFGFLLMMFPVQPLMTIWMVQRFEIVRKEDFQPIFNKFLLWFFIINVMVILIISLTVQNLLEVMSSPRFWDAHKVVPIILVAYFFQACTDYFNFGIFHTGKTKHMAYGTTIGVIIILLFSFILIPQFGIFGAAWATLISFLTRLLYVYFASQKLFKIDYQLFKPFQVFLLGAFIYLIYFFEIKLFPSTNDLLWVIPRVGVLLVLYFVLLFRLNILSSNEKRLFYSTLRAPFKTFGEIKSQNI